MSDETRLLALNPLMRSQAFLFSVSLFLWRDERFISTWVGEDVPLIIFSASLLAGFPELQISFCHAGTVNNV